MKLFVLGASHTGKSPLARLLATELGCACIGASAWVRAQFPALAADAPAAARAAQVAEMTAWAADALRRDPDRSAAELRGRIAAAAGACVIEGIRNPYDFTTCFDPRTDVAVMLRYAGAGALAPTAFEGGLDVIRAYLDWLAATGLLAHAVREVTVPGFGELERVARELIAGLPAVRVAGPPVRVHAAIAPLRTHVRAEYLYGMDPARVGELRACTAFSVASYLGSTPTFQVLTDADGAVFSYVPPSALVDPARRAAPELALADLVYHDCKSTEICVHAFDALRGPVLAYFKRLDLWLAADYLFTIDWYAGNEMLHALALANGQYALLPSHKVKFGDHPAGFEPYRKIRRTWTVEPRDDD